MNWKTPWVQHDLLLPVNQASILESESREAFEPAWIKWKGKTFVLNWWYIYPLPRPGSITRPCPRRCRKIRILTLPESSRNPPPLNQSINQSINQSTNQAFEPAWIKWKVRHLCHYVVTRAWIPKGLVVFLNWYSPKIFRQTKSFHNCAAHCVSTFLPDCVMFCTPV